MERSRDNIESSHDTKIVSGLMTINICMQRRLHTLVVGGAKY